MNRDTITPGQIVMHPNGQASFLLVAVVFLPALLMLLAFSANLSVVGTVVLIVLATTLPGVYHYTTQVIVDAAQRTVQCKTLLGSRTYPFAEVHGVQKVNALNGANYYVLTTTADPYGQGIRLSDRSLLARKAPVQFEQNVLPALNKMLSEAGISVGTTAKSQDSAEKNRSVTTCRQNGGQYWFYDMNLLNTGAGVVLFVVALRGLMNYDPANWNRFMANTNVLNPLLSLLSPLWLLVSVALVARGTLRVVIDPAARTLTRKFLFGLVRRTHSIYRPADLYVQSNRTNGRHTGTDVHIRVGAGNKRIVLRHFAKTVNVDAFVADTKKILGETAA